MTRTIKREGITLEDIRLHTKLGFTGRTYNARTGWSMVWYTVTECKVIGEEFGGEAAHWLSCKLVADSTGKQWYSNSLRLYKGKLSGHIHKLRFVPNYSWPRERRASQYQENIQVSND